MNEKDNKNKYTMEEYLDERLGEQTQVIISAVESVLEKRLGETGVRTDSRFEAVGGRLDEMEGKIDKVQTTLDGYVKKQEDSKQERVIVEEEIEQMKDALKEKLGIEIRAV